MKKIHRIWELLGNVCGMDLRLIALLALFLAMPTPNELAKIISWFLSGATLALAFANPYWRAICDIHKQSAAEWRQLYRDADEQTTKILQLHCATAGNRPQKEKTN